MIKNALKDLHLKLKPKGGGSRGENYIIQLSPYFRVTFGVWGVWVSYSYTYYTLGLVLEDDRSLPASLSVVITLIARRLINGLPFIKYGKV